MVDQKVVDHYADMDIDELEMELEDLNNAIRDTRMRLKSVSDIDAARFNLFGIKSLEREAAYVRKLIKELMDE